MTTTAQRYSTVEQTRKLLGVGAIVHHVEKRIYGRVTSIGHPDPRWPDCIDIEFSDDGFHRDGKAVYENVEAFLDSGCVVVLAAALVYDFERVKRTHYSKKTKKVTELPAKK